MMILVCVARVVLLEGGGGSDSITERTCAEAQELYAQCNEDRIQNIGRLLGENANEDGGGNANSGSDDTEYEVSDSIVHDVSIV